MIEIEHSDALKILDALTLAEEFFIHRDEMNARLHAAREVRFAPLASIIISERQRLNMLISEQSE